MTPSTCAILTMRNAGAIERPSLMRARFPTMTCLRCSSNRVHVTQATVRSEYGVPTPKDAPVQPLQVGLLCLGCANTWIATDLRWHRERGVVERAA